MSKLNDDISTVNQKVQLLIRKHVQLISENELLIKQLDASVEKQKQLEETVNYLRQKVIILKASVQKLNESDKRELHKNIDNYLATIDKCINTLSE